LNLKTDGTWIWTEKEDTSSSCSGTWSAYAGDIGTKSQRIELVSCTQEKFNVMLKKTREENVLIGHVSVVGSKMKRGVRFVRSS
jgi:hypothetical protein